MIADPAVRKLAGTLFCWKTLVLLAVVALSAVIHRPFCRYLCPLGAFYALFNRFSFFQMHLEERKCIGCQKCVHSCPMAVDVVKNINHPECIRCGKCQAVCPANAIHFGIYDHFVQTEEDRRE